MSGSRGAGVDRFEAEEVAAGSDSGLRSCCCQPDVCRRGMVESVCSTEIAYQMLVLREYACDGVSGWLALSLHTRRYRWLD